MRQFQNFQYQQTLKRYFSTLMAGYVGAGYKWVKAVKQRILQSHLT